MCQRTDRPTEKKWKCTVKNRLLTQRLRCVVIYNGEPSERRKKILDAGARPEVIAEAFRGEVSGGGGRLSPSPVWDMGLY